MGHHPCSKKQVSIPIAGDKKLVIYAENHIEQDTLLELPDSSIRDHGEEPVQLLEGASYEYELPEGYSLEEISRIIHPSRIHTNSGRITPGIYVGCLTISIYVNGGKCDSVSLEVRSVKTEYRSEYRRMLEDITGECTELLMIHSSPVSHRFTVDYEVNSRTLYQRFAFVKSIADSDGFRNAVHRVIAMPVMRRENHSEERDIRRLRRITPSLIRRIASEPERIALPKNHPLSRRSGITSVPSRLRVEIKTDTVDTPENRFVKHVLQEFHRFCGMVCRHIENQNKNPGKRPHIYLEALALEERFGEYLSHDIFRKVSRPNYLPLNSPVLQRKEGYRKILRTWLMFDLAAKLTWDAFDKDQYDAGKRDVATLYEYWLFFKLLRLVQEIFSIQPEATEKLIKKTGDGLGLQLRTGKHIAVQGRYIYKKRRLKVEFNYNRTFSRTDYPHEGTWTKSMRPDYTLSLWPADFPRTAAEEQELIVHVHFDAKYRVDDLRYLISDEAVSLDAEKIEQKEGRYRRADLLKMHTYKDAIRRTAGAYVLYPGTKTFRQTGYHEIIPGLGAFPVSPSNAEDGIDHLRNFIKDVVSHFADRASQREELSYRSYKVHKKRPNGNELHEMLPEMFNGFRTEPPGTTTILVGYCKNERHYEWICTEGLYNIRIDDKGGPKKINPAVTGARYLLLHRQGELESNDLWYITGDSPVMMNRKTLLAKGYPNLPSQEYYMVYQVRKAEQDQFAHGKWDIRKLPGYKTGRTSARPFSVTLFEMMQAVIVSK
jgi:predicted component of viral defense system (DUF524 family)